MRSAIAALVHGPVTQLADSEARIETPLGDARLTLEREPPADLDLLAVDAFSSYAIPVHLITAEALALYARQGVDEYWIVDWQQRTLEVYRRTGEGLALALTLGGHDVLETPLLPGSGAPLPRIWPKSL